MLWAVNIKHTTDTPAARFPSYFPTKDQAAAQESADVINEWVSDMERRHPDHAPSILAEVIEWPGEPSEHHRLLAESEENSIED